MNNVILAVIASGGLGLVIGALGVYIYMNKIMFDQAELYDELYEETFGIMEETVSTMQKNINKKQEEIDRYEKLIDDSFDIIGKKQEVIERAFKVIDNQGRA